METQISETKNLQSEEIEVLEEFYKSAKEVAQTMTSEEIIQEVKTKPFSYLWVLNKKVDVEAIKFADKIIDLISSEGEIIPVQVTSLGHPPANVNGMPLQGKLKLKLTLANPNQK